MAFITERSGCLDVGMEYVLGSLSAPLEDSNDLCASLIPGGTPARIRNRGDYDAIDVFLHSITTVTTSYGIGLVSYYDSSIPVTNRQFVSMHDNSTEGIDFWGNFVNDAVNNLLPWESNEPSNLDTNEDICVEFRAQGNVNVFPTNQGHFVDVPCNDAPSLVLCSVECGLDAPPPEPDNFIADRTECLSTGMEYALSFPFISLDQSASIDFCASVLPGGSLARITNRLEYDAVDVLLHSQNENMFTRIGLVSHFINIPVNERQFVSARDNSREGIEFWGNFTHLAADNGVPWQLTSPRNLGIEEDICVYFAVDAPFTEAEILAGEPTNEGHYSDTRCSISSSVLCSAECIPSNLEEGSGFSEKAAIAAAGVSVVLFLTSAVILAFSWRFYKSGKGKTLGEDELSVKDVNLA